MMIAVTDVPHEEVEDWWKIERSLLHLSQVQKRSVARCSLLSKFFFLKKNPRKRECMLLRMFEQAMTKERVRPSNLKKMSKKRKVCVGRSQAGESSSDN
jgi:hypothetical protein